MTPEQIKLVQENFTKVDTISEQAAELFYNTLFSIDPSLEELFTGDMAEQGRKLMASIKLVVEGLDNLEGIVPAINSLADRHVDYGVKPEHYATVGQALIQTLEAAFGDEFTPETKEAWVQAYAILSDTMIQHAYQDAA